VWLWVGGEGVGGGLWGWVFGWWVGGGGVGGGVGVRLFGLVVVCVLLFDGGVGGCGILSVCGVWVLFMVGVVCFVLFFVWCCVELWVVLVGCVMLGVGLLWIVVVCVFFFIVCGWFVVCGWGVWGGWCCVWFGVGWFACVVFLGCVWVFC